MLSKSLLIKEINQKDNHTFSIRWDDDSVQDFRLSALQKNCPCAECREGKVGKKLISDSMVKDEVRAVRIRNIGRYALQIQFSAGCSKGIYSFEMLRNLEA